MAAPRCCEFEWNDNNKKKKKKHFSLCCVCAQYYKYEVKMTTDPKRWGYAAEETQISRKSTCSGGKTTTTTTTTNRRDSVASRVDSVQWECEQRQAWKIGKDYRCQHWTRDWHSRSGKVRNNNEEHLSSFSRTWDWYKWREQSDWDIVSDQERNSTLTTGHRFIDVEIPRQSISSLCHLRVLSLWRLTDLGI